MEDSLTVSPRRGFAVFSDHHRGFRCAPPPAIRWSSLRDCKSRSSLAVCVRKGVDKEWHLFAPYLIFSASPFLVAELDPAENFAFVVGRDDFAHGEVVATHFYGPTDTSVNIFGVIHHLHGTEFFDETMQI